MAYRERAFLIHRLEEARSQIEALLPQAKQHLDKEIYPQWRLKEFLAHMSGWDNAVIASLRAHAGGQEPGTPAERGINAYNAQTVSTREALDYEHIHREWTQTREILKQALYELSDDKYLQPLVFPWGESGSIAYLIEIFIDHEEHHAEELRRWLGNPETHTANSH